MVFLESSELAAHLWTVDREPVTKAECLLAGSGEIVGIDRSIFWLIVANYRSAASGFQALSGTKAVAGQKCFSSSWSAADSGIKSREQRAQSYQLFCL